MRPMPVRTTSPFAPRSVVRLGCALLLLPLMLAAVGCGINKSRLATEQLVVADAVDEAVSKVDFSALSGRKVYMDTSYIDGLKLSPYSNIEYVISSMRQQMVAYNCQMQSKKEDAEFIVELRVGALANDGDEVTYGIPSSSVKSAATAVPSIGSLLPPIPEISFGRRIHQIGAAKVGVFAYDRVTGEPVWQSAMATGTSEARDLWLLGLGPFQKGRIYKRMDKDRIDRALAEVDEDSPDSLEVYRQAVVFDRATRPGSQQQAASSETAVAEKDKPKPKEELAPIVSIHEPPKGAGGATQNPVAGKPPGPPPR